jgi:PKD repeat protein
MNRVKAPLVVVSLLLLALLALILGGCAGNKPPTASIASPKNNDTLNSKIVEFKGTGTDPEKKAITYAWDFGDGKGKSTEQNPKYTYEKPGSYTATLTVTDDKKKTAQAKIAITVKSAPPVAKITATPPTGDAPLEVQFDPGASDPDGPATALKYSWDFGDGGKDTTAKPAHTYAKAGTYNVTLTVTDSDNMTATAKTTITVKEAPPPTPPAGPPSPPPGS